jgi:hypothetical protein
MTEGTLYPIQLLGFGLMLYLFLGRRDQVLGIQIALWTVFNTYLFFRYGIYGQLDFYSNDQKFYVRTTEQLLNWQFELSIDFLTEYLKLPFTMPSAVLAASGIHPVLAAKTTALGYLMASTHLVLKSSAMTHGARLAQAYLSGLIAIGVFFGSLAQRDTALVYFTLLFIFGKSRQTGLIGFVSVYMLRPHMAAALAIAYLISRFPLKPRNYIRVLILLTVSAAVAGHLSFALGTIVMDGQPWQLYGHRWGIKPVMRIFTNVVGLGFLTSNPDTVPLTTSALFLTRLVFFESLVIPALFIVALLFAGPPDDSTRISRVGLWFGFVFYLGIVTVTDFNSFRQNLPFVIGMGGFLIRTLSPPNVKTKLYTLHE